MTGADRRPKDAPRLYPVPDEPEDEEEQQDDPDWSREDGKERGGEVAVRDDAELAEPIEAEVVPEDEPRTLILRPIAAARTVARHDHTRTVAKVAAREALYVPVGVGVLLRRLWEAKTNSRYERMLRAAEAQGNWEKLEEWEQRAEQARERRHRRRMAWLAVPFQLAKGLLAGLLTVVFALLLLGIAIAIADSNVRQIPVPLLGVVRLIGAIAGFVEVVWSPPLAAAAFVAGLAWLWHVGRTSGAGPAWMAVSADDEDIVIDETTIARALEALRIPQITAYFKQGLPLQFITVPRIDGRGTHAVLRLPAGVTADRISRRRADLATGLHRLAKETWPSTGSEAGILDLWVANKGALAEGAGEYPLLAAGLVDVFKGVPLGKTLRGDPILAPLMERNTITGGIPGQGKSSSARAILAGAALDPTAEIWIHVPDSNFDFELFKRRATRYVMGADDEHIEKILHDLRDLYAEVQRRGQILIEQQEPAVTRALADAGIGLHPLFYLLEEAHLAIQHKQYGKEIAQLLIDIVKLGRKRGIHVIVSTQAPTKDSMPRDVTRNCSNGIAFAVGDHVANDALLGQGAYSAGHRATELIPGTDKGTAVCKGLSGERSDIVQIYFIPIEKGNDQLTPIIDRAMAAIAERGKGLPGRAPRRQAKPTRDLLADLDAVLGEEVVPVANVPALLARYAPDWAPYRSWSGKALRERLARDYGIKVPSTGNRWPLDPAVVREALARRRSEES